MFDIQFVPIFAFIWIILAYLWNHQQKKVKTNGLSKAQGDTLSLSFYVNDINESDTIHDLRKLSKSLYFKINPYSSHSNIELNEIEVTRLFQGATNKCYRVKLQDLHSFFIRVEGKGNFLSVKKSQEMHILQLCSYHNLSPKLYAIYTNGYVSEFINGEFLSVPMMADPIYSDKIATTISRFHKLRAPSSMKDKLDANVWNTIERYLKIAREHYPHDDPILKLIEEETRITKNDIEKHSRTDEIVLCHNDLNHGNIAYNKERDQITFVDLEFAGLNHRNFDLANHFSEWAGLDLKYDRCPTKEQQKRFLRIYVDSYYGNQLKNKEEYIEWMYIETYKWMQVSHLVWILWGIIQAKISDVDWNYEEYWKIRLDDYNKRKSECLNMTY